MLRQTLLTKEMTHLQARDYCKKRDETYVEGPWEYGDEPSQGKRVDLAAVKKDLDEGMGEVDIADKHFAAWIRYEKSFRLYRLLKQPPRSWVTYTTVYWGPSGVGKSRRAEYEAGPGYYDLSNSGGPTIWWDGYTGQAHVIIDEFYGWIKYHDMLRILDRYPLSVQVMFPAPMSLLNTSTSTHVVASTCMQVKGGHVQLLATHIWITSNDHPCTWYKRGLQSLQRRLEPPLGRVEEMPGPEVWQPPAAPLSPQPTSMGIAPFPGALRAVTPRATTPTLTPCGSSTRYVRGEGGATE